MAKILVIESETFIAVRRYLIDTGGKGTVHVVALDEAAQDGVYLLKKIEGAREKVVQAQEALLDLQRQ
jgi:hypothetical protein